MAWQFFFAVFSGGSKILQYSQELKGELSFDPAQLTAVDGCQKRFFSPTLQTAEIKGHELVPGVAQGRPPATPALYAGMAGPDYADLGWNSYLIVLLTSITGMIATLAWWELADQTK